jgi:hypothetical protein
MKTKIWIRAILFIALTVVTLVSCQGKSEKVLFSSPCSDIIDPWTPMSQDERIDACQELISSKAAELEKMGFEPQDCQVTKAKVQDCGIGTELACTYTCSDNE